MKYTNKRTEKAVINTATKLISK